MARLHVFYCMLLIATFKRSTKSCNNITSTIYCSVHPRTASQAYVTFFRCILYLALISRVKAPLFFVEILRRIQLFFRQTIHNDMPRCSFRNVLHKETRYIVM